MFDLLVAILHLVVLIALHASNSEDMKCIRRFRSPPCEDSPLRGPVSTRHVSVKTSPCTTSMMSRLPWKFLTEVLPLMVENYFVAPDNIAFRYQKSIYFTFVKIDYHCHLPFNIVVVDNLLTSEQSTYIQERNMVISHQGQGQVDLFLYPCPCP